MGYKQQGKPLIESVYRLSILWTILFLEWLEFGIFQNVYGSKHPLVDKRHTVEKWAS